MINKLKALTRQQKIAFSAAGILGILLLIYLIGVFYYSFHFLPNTTIDGVNVESMTVDQAKNDLRDSVQNRQIKLVLKDGQSEVISASDINLQYQNEDIVEDELKDQNAWSWPFSYLKSVRAGADENTGLVWDDNLLSQKIASLNAVTSADVQAPTDAHISYNEDAGKFEIVAETDGNQVNTDRLKESIENSLKNGQSEINLEQEQIYNRASVTTDDATLQKQVDLLNQKLDAKITYTLGENVEVVDKSVYGPWLYVDENNQVQVNPDGVESFIEKLDDYYWIFPTREDAEDMNQAMTAYLMDLDEESTKITNAILNNQTIDVTPESVTIKPIPVQQTSSIDPATGALTNSQGGDTYILIDIASQSMFFWKNGELLVSTPVTTGTAGLYDTPTGKFKLYSKSTDVVLRGDDYASPVTFWLPFDGDIGIHDASWRSNYGGDIYLTSGSHGCINTPYEAVSVIYNNIDVGTTVIVQ